MRASINIWLLVVLIGTHTYQVLYSSFTTTETRHSAFHYLPTETDQSHLLVSNRQSTLPFLTSERDPLTLNTDFGSVFTSTQANSASLPYQSPNMTTTAQHSLSVTLHSEPRIHLKSWLKATYKYARSLAPTLDPYGALYLVCSDTAWAALKHNQVLPPTSLGPMTTRARPVFPPPTKPEAGDQPSTRHKWKTQKTDYDIETNAESTLVAVLLASIGPTNELIL